LEGIAGSSRFETDCLLKFVAVREEARNEGKGKALVGRVLGFHSGKCRRAYLLTAGEKRSYFLQFGFVTVTQDDLPDSIRNSHDLSGMKLNDFDVMRLEMPRSWPII
jgi:N-acetylglutamate synthase-like GNAT family acetyltransferase